MVSTPPMQVIDGRILLVLFLVILIRKENGYIPDFLQRWTVKRGVNSDELCLKVIRNRKGDEQKNRYANAEQGRMFHNVVSLPFGLNKM